MQNDNIHNSLAGYVAKAVEDGNTDAAMERLDSELSERETAEAYYLRGRLMWKLGRKAEAMSDYSKAAAIDPSSPASAALEMARDVMNFFNPDLYNP